MDDDHEAREAAVREASDLRPLRLLFAGRCVRCGLELARGSDALYDVQSKTVRCVSCPTIVPGVAGASAGREYERRKASRERRIKDRFGRRVGGALLFLSDEPQSTRASARGSEGEQELAKALAGLDGVRVLHDRRVPGTRGNIDHIVIGPAGVFVVDAKLYAGTIRVRDVGGFFKRDERLFVGRRDCSKLADNMAWQVEAVERVLRSIGTDPTPPITPVLCFVRGHWPLIRPPDSYHRVRLVGTRSINKLLIGAQALDSVATDACACRRLAGEIMSGRAWRRRRYALGLAGRRANRQ